MDGGTTPREHPNRRRIVVLGGLVLLLLIGAIWLFGFRDTATPVSREDILSSLTTTTTTTLPASTATSTAPDPTVAPPPGAEAYVYATTGFESVDALGGARHDYPIETYLSERPGGCGTIFRWDALVERWSEFEVCDGLLASETEYHRWFGQDDEEVFVCDDGAYWVPPDDTTTTWTFACTSPLSTSTYTAELQGIEQMAFGAQTVAAYHLKVTSTTSGRTTGTTSGDVWRTVDGGLPVREAWLDMSTTESPIGPINYQEQVDVRVGSLVPLS